jgi:hypothetical protein
MGLAVITASATSFYIAKFFSAIHGVIVATFSSGNFPTSIDNDSLTASVVVIFFMVVGIRPLRYKILKKTNAYIFNHVI